MSTPHESDERAREPAGRADPELARLDELGRLTELGRETRQLRESELARLTELERWGSIQRYVPYGGLVIGTVLTLLVRDVDWPAWWVDLAFAGAAALWVRLCRPEYGIRPVPGPVFFVVWTLLAGALVVCSPWNGFVAFVGYLFALDLLPGRWRFAGVAVTAVLAATSQLGGLPPATGGGLAIWGAVVLVNAVLASWFGYYGWLTDQQSAERKRTIDQLNEANERLAAAMQENAQLQAQLVASARDAGVRDERERLAREIHDTLAQGLAGIVAQLQAARTAGPTSRERHLDTAAELARSTLVEARRSVQALRPEPLEAARLPDALADVAARWSEVSGVPAAVTTTGTARQLHPGGGDRAAADRTGGAGQRGQARDGQPGRGDVVVHGGRGDAGRAGRRDRVRPGRPARGGRRRQRLRSDRHAAAGRPGRRPAGDRVRAGRGHRGLRDRPGDPGMSEREGSQRERGAPRPTVRRCA